MKQKFFLSLCICVGFLFVVFSIYSLLHKTSEKKLVHAAVDPLAKIPIGHYLSQGDIQQAYRVFHDQYLTGGQEQESPRIVRWVSPNTFIFLQFDRPKASEAKKLQFIGLGEKGVYCSETKPDNSFTHFVAYDAPHYDQVNQLQPGDQGYWLSFASVGSFTYDGRRENPGIDYQYDLMTPPSCGVTKYNAVTRITPVSDRRHRLLLALMRLGQEA